MYAPKFRSWMTDWERFEEGLDRRLNIMAEEALAEIHEMAEKAMPVKAKTKPADTYNNLLHSLLANQQQVAYNSLNYLNQQRNALQNVYPAGDYYGIGAAASLGNIFGRP